MSQQRQAKRDALLAFDPAILADFPHCQQVVGVDEVGRGSYIGPIVAAAVCFHHPLSEFDLTALEMLDDSKASHLNHPKRLALAETIRRVAAWGLAEATQPEVETLNVAQASLLASRRAIAHLFEQFPIIARETALVVLDGKTKLKGYDGTTIAIVKADGQSAGVAAASILAKAHRDAWVIEQAVQYPQYDWAKNKGYGVKAHLAAIAEHGACPLHRQNFKMPQQLTLPVS